MERRSGGFQVKCPKLNKFLKFQLQHILNHSLDTSSKLRHSKLYHFFELQLLVALSS